MHFNFFGDSWYWDWSPGGNFVNHPSLKNIHRFDFFGKILPELGHTLSNFCEPGNTPYDIFEGHSAGPSFPTKINKKEAGFTDTVKPGISIIFYSSLIRQNSINNKYNLLNYVKDYNEFKIKKKETEINFLKSLQTYSLLYKQKVYIIGGHAPFLTDVPKKFYNVKVLSKDILSTLYLNHHPYDINNHKIGGFFRLATDITDAIDETWDKDLVIKIYDDIKKHETLTLGNYPDGGIYRSYVWPDMGHLNQNGLLLTLDLILKEIEK